MYDEPLPRCSVPFPYSAPIYQIICVSISNVDRDSSHSKYLNFVALPAHNLSDRAFVTHVIRLVHKVGLSVCHSEDDNKEKHFIIIIYI